VGFGSSVLPAFEVLSVFGFDSDLARSDKRVRLRVPNTDVGTIELHHGGVIVLVVRIDAKGLDPVLAVWHEAAEVHQLIGVVAGHAGIRVKDAYAVRFVVELPDGGRD